ncbi:hypothetical protein J6590_043185 [Homalodisca vitripennis]|nr:hypothetical protein J6590_043185 [Homalodisca vitripennis]
MDRWELYCVNLPAKSADSASSFPPPSKKNQTLCGVEALLRCRGQDCHIPSNLVSCRARYRKQSRAADRPELIKGSAVLQHHCGGRGQGHYILSLSLFLSRVTMSTCSITLDVRLSRTVTS